MAQENQGFQEICWRCFRPLNELEAELHLCESCTRQRDTKASEVLDALYTMTIGGDHKITDICLASIAFSLEEMVRLGKIK
jgi:hypothetical protein